MSQKYILFHPPNKFSSLTIMRFTKTISRLGMASYRKSLLATHSVMEICFSRFMDTKYKCLTLGAIAVVSDIFFSQLIAKVRAVEHCIQSAFR